MRKLGVQSAEMQLELKKHRDGVENGAGGGDMGRECEGEGGRS